MRLIMQTPFSAEMAKETLLPLENLLSTTKPSVSCAVGLGILTVPSCLIWYPPVLRPRRWPSLLQHRPPALSLFPHPRPVRHSYVAEKLPPRLPACLCGTQ